VLGLRRAFSTRKDAPQEIVSVGKMEQKFGPKAGKWEWRPTVMGEYFKEEDLRAFTMYKHGETATPDFPGDTEKQMEATAVHEIAHGVFRYAIPGFIADNGYWLDEDTKSGTAGAEGPPTSYGNTNAREDLSETVMFYFVDPERLKKGNGAAAGKPGNACPKRFAYIDGLVKGWTPAPPPKPPVGDFPERDPNATTGVA
jgi:hypothetical protein